MATILPDKLYNELSELGLDFVRGVFPGWAIPNYNSIRTRYYQNVYLNYHRHKYGKLHVIAYDPNHVASYIAARKKSCRNYTPEQMISQWKKYNFNILCYCECGNLTYVKPRTLVRKNRHDVTQCNCGCEMRNIVSENNKLRAKHGLTKTRIYGIWSGMIDRCTNPRNPRYLDYGGRGITICNEWYDSSRSGLRDHTDELLRFAKWANDHGFYEQDLKTTRNRDLLSLDRKDSNGNYCPENCHFIPKGDQALNRGTNTVVMFNKPGEEPVKRTVVGLVDQYRVNSNRVHKRLIAGFSPYNAVTMPTRYTRKKENCKPLPRDPSTYDQYDGPRYNEHGELRDKDGFIVLDWKKDIHAIVEGYKKNKESKD